jgi:hypothetical protein
MLSELTILQLNLFAPRLIACWDCGFESRREYYVFSGTGLCDWPIPRPEDSNRVCVSLSVIRCNIGNVVCCQVEVSATGRSLVQRIPTECVCVFECDQVL